MFLNKKRTVNGSEKKDNNDNNSMNGSKKRNEFDMKSINSNYIKQWVKSELNKKDGHKHSLINTSNEHNQNDSMSSNYEVRYSNPNKKRIFDKPTYETTQSPYKCIFNLNEKNYTTSSISDLKTQFEQKREENKRIFEDMKKKTTIKALINLEDSNYINNLMLLKNSSLNKKGIYMVKV